jgi:hypothetical protein
MERRSHSSQQAAKLNKFHVTKKMHDKRATPSYYWTVSLRKIIKGAHASTFG